MSANALLRIYQEAEAITSTALGMSGLMVDDKLEASLQTLRDELIVYFDEERNRKDASL